MARKKLAIILSGGGARGAYQVGILESWRDLFLRGGAVEILIGVSAGSINAVRLMQSAPNYASGIDALKRLWSTVSTEEVFESDFKAVVKNLMRLMHSSRYQRNPHNDTIVNAVLNTSPLHAYLGRHIDMGQVQLRLRTMPDHALAVHCFDYTDMKNVAFFQTREVCPSWERSTVRGVRTTLALEHVLASCSVPLIFPPWLIDGHYYGDGSLRNMTPLNSAIRLGADRIISISLRGDTFGGEHRSVPTLGRIAATMLDSMFLDALDIDSQFMNRVNMLATRVPEAERDVKIIDLCRIGPMLDFSLIASRFRHRFPRTLRYLFGGWISSDMLSYLLFDSAYAEELMEHGRKDGELFREVVEEWLREDAPE
jgi:NTE family protein